MGALGDREGALAWVHFTQVRYELFPYSSVLSPAAVPAPPSAWLRGHEGSRGQGGTFSLAPPPWCCPGALQLDARPAVLRCAIDWVHASGNGEKLFSYHDS